MTTQEIRYCTTEDGVNIAYATSGIGSRTPPSGSWQSVMAYVYLIPGYVYLSSRRSDEGQADDHGR